VIAPSGPVGRMTTFSLRWEARAIGIAYDQNPTQLHRLSRHSTLPFRCCFRLPQDFPIFDGPETPTKAIASEFPVMRSIICCTVAGLDYAYALGYFVVD
jgi:hypothetical protein